MRNLCCPIMIATRSSIIQTWAGVGLHNTYGLREKFQATRENRLHRNFVLQNFRTLTQKPFYTATWNFIFCCITIKYK